MRIIEKDRSDCFWKKNQEHVRQKNVECLQCLESVTRLFLIGEKKIGFQKMVEGLSAFNEGLVEHGLIDRTAKNGETIDQGIKREISDMARLMQEIHRIDDAAKRVLTEGLVKYAMGFYLLMRSKDVDTYKEVVEKIAEYFHYMDSTYYTELEGQPDDMKKLAEFLNQFSL
jgi:hypothetical protein